MANHSLPTISSGYSNFVNELDARFDDLALGLDPAVTTATNVPTNTVRWNSAGNSWQKWNGTAWNALTAGYSININGTVGATTPSTGAFTTLSTSGVASLGASSTVGGVAIVTTTGSQTLTNKTLTTPTISSIVNTGTLTLPTATTTLVGTTTTDTLTNKTLTAPRFADLGFIADASGNELLIFDQTASAVNELTLANAATTGAPTISATGGDTNISINFAPKGTGTVNIVGVPIVTTTGTQTLTNKTLTTPTISSIINTGTLTLPTATTTLVGTNTTDTLTNKTLTAPRFADLGFIADASGNELLIFDQNASAVNEVTLSNSVTGLGPTIASSGGDLNIDLNLSAKGTGVVKADGLEVVTVSGAQTLTDKTWNGVTIGLAYGGTGATTAASARTNLDVPTRTGTDASGTWGISITGNAATATNGVVTTGSYSNPSWITALDAAKLTTGTIPDARITGTYSGFTHKIDGGNTVYGTTSTGSTNTSARTVYGLADYRSSSSVETGAIVFIAPDTTSTIMHEMQVQGLLYNSNIVNFIIQGYRTTAAWSATKKVNLGTIDVQVRWAVTPDGKNCLILGDVGTSWSYPHLSITRAHFSHTNAGDAYCTGWTVAVVTDLSLYTNVTSTITNTSIAGSVDTLGTARTINGTNFDGSANITTSSWGTSRTITLGDTGKSIDGSGNVTWTLTEIGAADKDVTVNLTGDQSVAGIKTFTGTIRGGDNVNLQLGDSQDLKMYHNGTDNYIDVVVGNLIIRDNVTTRFTFDRTTGNLTATGNVTGYSDERLKSDWATLDPNFLTKLAGIKYGTYTRIDTRERQVGVSAQALSAVLKEAVAEDSEGFLSVAYGNAALVACVELAKEVVSLRSRLDKLEK